MDQRSMQAVRIHIRASDGAEEKSAGRSGGARQPAEGHPAGEEQVDQAERHPAGEEQVGDADVENMEVCTTSTNTADDYAHRGAHLQTMPFYVYRMYVRRVLKRSKAKDGGARFFAFEEHYVMAHR